MRQMRRLMTRPDVRTSLGESWVATKPYLIWIASKGDEGNFIILLNARKCASIRTRATRFRRVASTPGELRRLPRSIRTLRIRT